MLLAAYAQGLFPMAERRDDPTLYWVSPELRGILPLENFHLPHRLARTVRSGRFTVSSDRAFGQVMQECAAPRPGREQSWINSEIIRRLRMSYAASAKRQSGQRSSAVAGPPAKK